MEPVIPGRPAEKEPSEKDVLGRLAKKLESLIRTQEAIQKNQGKIILTQGKALKQILKEHDEIIAHDRKEKEKEKRKKHLELTFPTGGSTQSFPTGTSTVDFYEGKIYYPGGTSGTLKRNLKENNIQNFQVLFLKTDTQCDVEIEGIGRITVVDYLLIVTNFQRIYITTTQSTAINFWASTNPAAYLSTAKRGSGSAARTFQKTLAEQDLSVAALSKTTSSSNSRWRLIQVLLHANAAITETITITFVSGDGTKYNTVLEKAFLNSATDYRFTPKNEIIGLAGDEVQVQCTNNNAAGTVDATIIQETL